MAIIFENSSKIICWKIVQMAIICWKIVQMAIIC